MSRGDQVEISSSGEAAWPQSSLAHTRDAVLQFLGWGFDRTLSCSWSKHCINIFFTNWRVELPPFCGLHYLAVGQPDPLYFTHSFLQDFLFWLLLSFYLIPSTSLSLPHFLTLTLSFFNLFTFYLFSLFFNVVNIRNMKSKLWTFLSI